MDSVSYIQILDEIIYFPLRANAKMRFAGDKNVPQRGQEINIFTR